MVELQELKDRIDSLDKKLADLRKLLNIEEKKKSIGELQLKMAENNFWDDQKSASKIIDKLKFLKDDVDDWDNLAVKLAEVKELISISDASLLKEILEEIEKIEQGYEKLNLKILFSDKFDENSAIVEINSGAGGTESCDWASMLFRMYSRWAEDKKFKFTVYDEVKGEEAGLKNITFFIEGKFAYGLLKSERGVHRLVRISPFDANKRRHTSFASVDVLPEIKEDANIEINSEDLKIDTFRASGAGGQHVNKTDSAVRITHLPTGIVTGSQNERSQYQNKHTALKVLLAKLYQRKEEEKKKKLDKISGKKQKIEWGSQIRSYVLHPYLLVKDHRTDVEVHDAWGVLDGKLDNFMYSYLKYLKTEEKLNN